MKLYEKWYADYVGDRYLSHLTADELNDRFRYLFENVSTLTDTGQIGIRGGQKGDSLEILELFSHALKEQWLRDPEFRPRFLKDAAVPKPRTEISNRLVDVRNRIVTNDPHLLKFGKAKYLEAAANSGKLRVSLASTYDDPSLNLAQKDSELSLTFQIDSSGMTARSEDGVDLGPIHSATFSLEVPDDYYVFCCSHTFDFRLFDDFDADSCLVIEDSHRFAEEIMGELSKVMNIKDRTYGPVQYIDPVRGAHHHFGEKRPIVQMAKHLRYFYQNEYRLVWVFDPDKGVTPDPYVDLILSGLPEYSRLEELCP